MSTSEFKGPIEGYVVNFLAKNYWRVQRSIPRDDCMQEAIVVYLRCKRKYPDVEDKHFMALFKTAWGNHFTDLSNSDTSRRAEVSESDRLEFQQRAGGMDELAEHVGDLENDGYLSTMIRQAPREIAMVLSLFLDCPSELLEMALDSWRRNGRYRAGGSRHINKMLGFHPDRDVLKEVEDYFRH